MGYELMMKLWAAVCLVGVPLLVFSAKPTSHRYWRMGRSILAIAAGYGVTMILFYLEYQSSSGAFHSRLGAHWFVLGWLWTVMYLRSCLTI